jgi:hypothetical protein
VPSPIIQGLIGDHTGSHRPPPPRRSPRPPRKPSRRPGTASKRLRTSAKSIRTLFELARTNAGIFGTHSKWKRTHSKSIRTFSKSIRTQIKTIRPPFKSDQTPAKRIRTFSESNRTAAKSTGTSFKRHWPFAKKTRTSPKNPPAHSKIEADRRQKNPAPIQNPPLPSRTHPPRVKTPRIHRQIDPDSFQTPADAKYIWRHPRDFGMDTRAILSHHRQMDWHGFAKDPPAARRPAIVPPTPHSDREPRRHPNPHEGRSDTKEVPLTQEANTRPRTGSRIPSSFRDPSRPSWFSPSFLESLADNWAEGPAPYQPRATPWESDPERRESPEGASHPAKNVAPLQGFLVGGARVPRALPWAGMRARRWRSRLAIPVLNTLLFRSTPHSDREPRRHPNSHESRSDTLEVPLNHEANTGPRIPSSFRDPSRPSWFSPSSLGGSSPPFIRF